MVAVNNPEIRKLTRYCVVCDKKLIILVNSDKTYRGGTFLEKLI